MNEIELWRAVLDRALRDLFGRDPAERRRTLAWVYSGGPDFQMVCLFAGRNPGLLRFKVLELLTVRKLIKARGVDVPVPLTLAQELAILNEVRAWLGIAPKRGFGRSSSCASRGR